MAHSHDREYFTAVKRKPASFHRVRTREVLHFDGVAHLVGVDGGVKGGRARIGYLRDGRRNEQAVNGEAKPESPSFLW